MARNIVPRTNKGADLGTPAKNWNTVYADSVIANNVQGENLKAVEQSAGDEITLRSLIVSAGSTPMSITVYDDIPITDDLIVPENIELNFKRGGKLSVSATKTLTINGSILAGLHQIFSGDGSVSFGSISAIAYPQWWGAKGDGITDDTTALQSYIDSLSPDATFKLPSGNWLISSTLIFNTAVNIDMEGYIIADVSNAPAMSLIPTFSTNVLNFRIKKKTQSDWSTDTSSGVLITGRLHRSKVNVYHIHGFYRGIYFFYDGAQSSAWNTFNIHRISNCKRAVEIYLQGERAWWNENTFKTFHIRVDSNVHPGEDFYGIYAHSDVYYSFNRNIILYPSWEGARTIGLYAERTQDWTVINPRNEAIGEGRAIKMVNCVRTNYPNRIEGVSPHLIDISYTDDILNYNGFFGPPYRAEDLNPRPLFSLDMMEIDTAANTIYPFVYSDVGTFDAPSFSYSTTLPSGSAAAWTKINGGYNYVYTATISKSGILIDLQGASLIDFVIRASTWRFRLVFLDATKNLVFNTTSDIKGANFYIPSFRWDDGYGFYFNSDITSLHRTAWVNSDTVKYLMVHVAANTGFISAFDVYTDSMTSKLVTE